MTRARIAKPRKPTAKQASGPAPQPPAKVRIDWAPAVLEHIRGGHAPQVAAAMCEISGRTLLRRRADDRDFNEAIQLAIDQSEGDYLEKVKTGDQNARWIMERRFWSRWSLKVATRRSEDAMRMLDAAERVLPVELYEQLLEELRRSESSADIEDATDPQVATVTDDDADDQGEARPGARAELPR